MTKYQDLFTKIWFLFYNTDICKMTRREPRPACVDTGACSYQRWPPCCLTVLHFVISDLYCTVAQLPHPCEIMQSYPDGSETLTLILTDFIWNYWARDLFFPHGHKIIFTLCDIVTSVLLQIMALLLLYKKKFWNIGFFILWNRRFFKML